MVKAFRKFMDFCYIVRRHTIDSATLETLEIYLAEFHEYRAIFQEVGIRTESPESGISLPRQHAMVHYISLIKQYGAPNGLDSSITESLHIPTVKKAWRRSSKYEPLGQILLTNQRNDKLAQARVDYAARGMLQPDLFGSKSKRSTAQDPETCMDPDLQPTNSAKVAQTCLAKTRGK